MKKLALYVVDVSSSKILPTGAGSNLVFDTYFYRLKWMSFSPEHIAVTYEPQTN